MLANGASRTLEFWIACKIRTAGLGGAAGFPTDFLEQIIHGLLPLRRRSAEVNLGPASQILLQNWIRQRIKFRGRCFWRFVPEISHNHSPTDMKSILHIKGSNRSQNRRCGNVSKCGNLLSESRARLRASLPVGGLKLVLLSIALGGEFSVSGLAIQLAARAVVESRMDVDPHLGVRIPHVDGRRRRFCQSKIDHQLLEQSQLGLRRRLLLLGFLRRRCVACGLVPAGRMPQPEITSRRMIPAITR